MNRADKKRTAKDKIIEASWELFAEKGYDDTTVNDIIERSQTSRGAFYHHFPGKEDLMFCLAYFLDEEYENWAREVDPSMNSLQKLFEFNEFIMKEFENSKYRPFFPQLYGMQAMTTSTRHMINPERSYYSIVNGFMREGIEKGEIDSERPYQELAEFFIIIERGFIYDWCLNKFRYSLVQHSRRIMSLYLDSLKPKQN